TSMFDNSTKILEYTQECKRLNIQILPPDINKSFAEFTVDGDDIRYGLAAIKNVGESFVDAICEEREFYEFTGFFDFCKRMAKKEFSKRAIESLIKVGAFDQFNINRRQLYNNFEQVLKSISQDIRGNLDGQIDLFSMTSQAGPVPFKIPNEFYFPECDEFEYYELLNFEKNLAGIYLSGHPVENYPEYSKNISTCNISQLTQEGNEIYDSSTQTVVAAITKCRYHTTKKNDIMCFATVEDLTGAIDVIIFPKVLQDRTTKLQENDVIIVKGRVSLKEEQATIVAEKIYDVKSDEAKDVLDRSTKQGFGLYIKFQNKNVQGLSRVRQILGEYSGDVPVYFYFVEEHQKLMAPEKLWIYDNSDMFNRIELIVGQGNIAYKK
ncbi:MAG: OB-fold nucleic acid binding domain-containing protein, partial [Oscillospiraceae bacterium]